MVIDLQIGDQTYKAKGTASVDRFYMNIFGVDPLVEQATPGFGAGHLISMMERMGFIMVKWAELNDPAKMNNLSESDFCLWLDNFERSEILEAFPKIRALYETQKKTTSVQKKRAGE